ncbi:MAG: hypothetical protein ACJ07L_04695 [Opitutales bacterium]
MYVEGELGRVETNRLILDTSEKSFGGIDILVPCASEFCLGTKTDTSREQWQKVINTNLNRCYNLLHF